MRGKINVFLFTSLILLVAQDLVAAQSRTISYPSIVSRLTDLKRLAELPAAGETRSMVSSYDRSSQYCAYYDKYLNWDANYDDYGCERMEGDKIVMADLQGPGCITRFWAAKTEHGHIRIYLDGAKTPTFDWPASYYFDGQHAPFNRPNLVYTTSGGPADGGPPSGGRNNYTPISFQRSCKIVADHDWGVYYQITYSTFPDRTIIPTFHPGLSAADNGALDRANRILGGCGQPPSDSVDSTTRTTTCEVNVPAGKTSDVATFTGPQALTQLKVKLALPSDAEQQRHLLRQLTLQITWDDDKSPAIWAPIGDFFAFVGGGRDFKTLPAGLDSGTFYSYWYMPFASKAHLQVTNDSGQPVAMTWTISGQPLNRPIAELARFHAKWHRDAFLSSRPDRQIDWTLLKTEGRGRLVGVQLHVWNPKGNWWGEGDEKFFVDGEKFPSSFGTGSEDYFGYAWCLPTYFSRPFHAQPLNENNQGHVDNLRWHISDSVPFQTSFEACLEKYFKNDRPTLYATTSFWYLASGGTDPYVALPVQQRDDYWNSQRN